MKTPSPHIFPAMLSICLIAFITFLDLYGVNLSKTSRLSALVLLFGMLIVICKPLLAAVVLQPLCRWFIRLISHLQKIFFFLFYFLFISSWIIIRRLTKSQRIATKSVWIDIRESNYFQRTPNQKNTVFANVLLFLYEGHPFLYIPLILFLAVLSGVFYMSDTNGAFSSFLKFLLTVKQS